MRKDSSNYRAHIMTSRLPLPLCMFEHLYIIVEKDGQRVRYEVLHKRYKDGLGRGYVRIRHFSHDEGLGIILLPIIDHIGAWRGRCIFETSGGGGSLAQRMHDFLEGDVHTYPNVDRYLIFPGPNSNTFVAWYLSHFPEIEIKLPRMAWGYDYQIKPLL